MQLFWLFSDHMICTNDIELDRVCNVPPLHCCRVNDQYCHKELWREGAIDVLDVSFLIKFYFDIICPWLSFVPHFSPPSPLTSLLWYSQTYLHIFLQDNDPSLTEVKFSNRRGLDFDLIKNVFESLKGNTALKSLQISNAVMDEKHAIVCYFLSFLVEHYT